MGFLHLSSDTPSVSPTASLFLVPWWLPEFLSTELQWSCQTKGRGEKQRVFFSVVGPGWRSGRHCSHPCRHIDYKRKLAFSLRERGGWEQESDSEHLATAVLTKGACCALCHSA